MKSKWEPQVVKTCPHPLDPMDFDSMVAELIELIYCPPSQLQKATTPSQVVSLEHEREAANE